MSNASICIQYPWFKIVFNINMNNYIDLWIYGFILVQYQQIMQNNVIVQSIIQEIIAKRLRRALAWPFLFEKPIHSFWR